jgi:exonuclease III
LKSYDVDKMTTLAALTVASYNVMQPLSKPWRVYGQEERAARVSEFVREHMSDVDVLVLQELITSESVKTVSADLCALGFTHHAGGLAGTTFRVPGGVHIFSKHPIASHDSCVFSSCSGFDCFASKGVVYAHIDGVHVFATHMQSDAGGISARRAQAKTIADCIASLNLSKDAPVLLLGDLNIDLLDVAELNEFQRAVGMRRVECDAVPTMDPHTNPLVGHDNPSQWPAACWSDYRRTMTCACCPTTRLDHMLIRGDISPTQKARAIRADIAPFEIQTDVGVVRLTSPSDHYPIVCTFRMPSRSAAPARTRGAMRSLTPNWTEHDVWMWGVVLAIMFAVVLATVIAVVCALKKLK